MADDMLPIPEGGVEVPIEVPQGGDILPIPEGGIEIPVRPPTIGGEMLRGAIQGYEERTAGLKLAGKDVEKVIEGAGHFFNKITELAPSDEDLIQTKREREEIYRKLISDRAAYEATMSVMPEGFSGAPARVGEFGASVAFDLPLMVVTGGRSAAGRMWASAAIGAASGSTLPAKDQEERSRNAALGAAFGATGTIAFEAARINANIIRRNLDKALSVPEVAARYEESAVLSKMTGIDFTTGQATGSRTLLAYENLAANASGSADEVLGYRNKQLLQSMDYLKGVITRLGDPEASPEVVGEQLKNGLLKTVDNLVGVRETSWDNFMSKAVVASGNKPIGVPSKTIAKLDEIIAEMSHPNSGYPASVIAKVKSLRNNATTPWTVKDFQITMKTWGRHASGKSQPFEKLHEADQKRIFREAMNAMREDLDDISTKGGVQGEAAKQLNLARASWGDYSGRIDELELTVLGDAIDKTGRPLSPEELYTKVRRMPASELKRIAPLMDVVDPAIMNNVRARVFSDAFEKAAAKSDSPTALVEFNPATFFKEVTAYPNADIIFKGADMKEYMTAVAAIKRISGMAGEGAALSPGQTASKAGALFGGGIEAQGLPNMVFLSKFLVENLTPRRYAKLLMTPEGRNAVITLGSKEMGLRKATNASIGTIVGILTSPDSLEPPPVEEPLLKGQVTVE